MRKTIIVFVVFFVSLGFCFGQNALNPFTKEKFKYGIYQSFEEIKNNEPSYTDSFRVKLTPIEIPGWEGKYSRSIEFEDSKEKPHGNWGFFDGSKFYVKFINEFFELLYDENFMGFWAFKYRADLNLFLPVGPVSFVHAEGSLEFAKKFFIMEDSNGWKTSTPFVSDDFSLPKTAKLILYRGGKKELDTPFKVSVNDSIKLEFVPQSYKELNINISKNPVKIKCENDSDVAIEIDLLRPVIKYVECSFKKKKEVFKIEEVIEKTGEFWSGKAKYLQEKRENKDSK